MGKRKILVLFIIIFFAAGIKGHSEENLLSRESGVKTDTFIVCGNCYYCKERIHDAIDSIPGLLEYNWDYSEILHAVWDDNVTSPAVFLDAIANVGHDTELIQAPVKAYRDLVGTCCEYDRWLTYENEMGTWQVQGTAECTGIILDVLLDMHGIIDGDWSDNLLSSNYFIQINNEDRILKDFALAGFDNELYTASDEDYNSLPDECKYRAVSVEKIESNHYTAEIYPQPAKEVINVKSDFEIERISVYSCDGKLIKIKDNLLYSDHLQINISELPKGIYILILSGNGNNETLKFIKE